MLRVRDFYLEHTGNIKETGIRQYNVAIFLTSSYTIGIKNLQIARHNLRAARIQFNKIIDYVHGKNFILEDLPNSSETEDMWKIR